MSDRRYRVPRLARWILRQMTGYVEDFQSESDFEEEYHDIEKEKGFLRAHCWYWFQVLGSIYPYVKSLLYWRATMLKQYFKVAFRNLRKKRIYSLVSISGLSIGMAVCFLLLMYVQHELSYDRFHERADHIYRLTKTNHPYHSPQTAVLLGENLPEIKEYARILVRGNPVVQYGNKRFKEKNDMVLADAELFRMFSFRFMRGNPETALNRPFSVVISDHLAQKYFGSRNPVGEVITLDGQFRCTITGVMENMPLNSHFRYDIIASLTDAEKLFGTKAMNNWGWENFLIYFHLKENISIESFEKKCTRLIARHWPSETNRPSPALFIQNLKDIHLYSAGFENDIQPQNNIVYVLVFSAIAVLILLIGCFNYINLLTANAATRAGEIGIKKAVGATRKQLASQFMGESMVVLLAALFLSLLLVGLGLPAFNTLSGKFLSLGSLIRGHTIAGILGIVLVTAVLAGFYPAFLLSGFQPVRALKGSVYRGRSKFHFKRVLVGIQFTVVIVLVCCAAVMFRQIGYLQHKELGFDKEFVLVSDADGLKDIVKYHALKGALMKQDAVIGVTAASRVPSDDLNNRAPLQPAGHPEPALIPMVHSAFDYFETLGVNASRGRLFSNQMKTDLDEAIILNEAAVKKLEIQNDPVGQTIQCFWPYSTRKIVGIVPDFHFESLYKRMGPAAFVPYHEMCRKLMVRVKPSTVTGSIKTIEEICQTFYPRQIFEFRFLDDRLDRIYQSEQKTFQLMGYFTVLAILIACMGLFGLASFMMKRRSREIGVRKVMGASVPRIIVDLTGDFVRWILITNIFAIPIAWVIMNRWLQNFAYHITMSGWMFLLSGLVALAIALMSLSWQAVRSATANPVKALRYE